jgi:adenylate kinase family enzyme
MKQCTLISGPGGTGKTTKGEHIANSCPGFAIVIDNITPSRRAARRNGSELIGRADHVILIGESGRLLEEEALVLNRTVTERITTSK